MREILFRGKRTHNDKWIVGSLHIEQFEGDNEYLCCEINQCDVIPETIGQYTGLCDKNGKKIFEGDIVTMPSYHGGKHKTVVYFKNGKFAVDGSNYHFKDIAPRNMEVIGNIHDSPELLREGEGK